MAAEGDGEERRRRPGQGLPFKTSFMGLSSPFPAVLTHTHRHEHAHTDTHTQTHT